jgi:hypothetical protein
VLHFVQFEQLKIFYAANEVNVTGSGRPSTWARLYTSRLSFCGVMLKIRFMLPTLQELKIRKYRSRVSSQQSLEACWLAGTWQELELWLVVRATQVETCTEYVKKESLCLYPSHKISFILFLSTYNFLLKSKLGQRLWPKTLAHSILHFTEEGEHKIYRCWYVVFTNIWFNCGLSLGTYHSVGEIHLGHNNALGKVARNTLPE